MDTSLKLYYLNSSNQAVAFPSGGASQAELLDFTLNKTRMGSAPTITGSLEYRTCLDSEWNNGHKFDDVFVEFNGEKFFLKATPSSSKSNEKDVYKHDLNFVSERIVLEHVLVVDCVGNETQNIIPSGSDEMVFFGDIRAFAERINQSMYFSDIGDSCMYQNGSMVPIADRTLNGDGYYIVVDDSVDTTEEKLISLGETMVLDALKEAVEKFNVPFYFVGRVIHFGSHKSVVLQGYTRGGVLGAGVSGNDLVPYEYGAAHSLLSVQRNNKNVEIITRCSGRGSEDNIPFYYPNPSAKGFITLTADPNNIASGNVLYIQNMKLFGASMELNEQINTFNSDVETIDSIVNKVRWVDTYNDPPVVVFTDVTEGAVFDGHEWGIWDHYHPDIDHEGSVVIPIYINVKMNTSGFIGGSVSISLRLFTPQESSLSPYLEKYIDMNHIIGVYNETYGLYGNVNLVGFNDHEVFFAVNYPTPPPINNGVMFRVDYMISCNELKGLVAQHYIGIQSTCTLNVTQRVVTLQSKPNVLKTIDEIGLGLLEFGDTIYGNKFYQSLLKYIKPQKNLMPSAYRNSDGLKMFYPAKNYPVDGVYGDQDSDIGETYSGGQIKNGNYEKTKGVFYVFENLYRKLRQREHIEDFSDIKPSISGMTNADYQRIDMFEDIAFDTNDSDDGHYDENGAFVYDHPYFFVKLRKTNGYGGFNLFECAIDEQDMSISMTSGYCAPCEFVIGVDEDTKKNLVQVDDNGDLLRDANGNVRCGREGMSIEYPQERQNDTENYEVWLALKKDTDTFGAMLPIETIRPVVGDTFVILHIQLPETYILSAEDKLTKAIVKYMYEHNFEAFDQSLNYSRAYLRDNSGIANVLDDCIKVATKYNGITKQMLVNTYSYKMQSTSPVPEITLGLIEEEDLIEKVAKEGRFVDGIIKQAIGANIMPTSKMISRNNAKFFGEINKNIKGKYISTKDSVSVGDIIVGINGKEATIINKGEDGQILKMVGNVPQWVDQS